LSKETLGGGGESMRRRLRNETGRRIIIAVVLLVVGTFTAAVAQANFEAAVGAVFHFASDPFSFNETALTLFWGVVGVAVIIGLIALRHARHPIPSFKEQAAAVLDPDEEIRHVTTCSYRYEPPPGPAFVEWLGRAEEVVTSLGGGDVSGGYGPVVIVCITNRRLAVMNPVVRAFRVRDPKMRWYTEPLSIERAELGTAFMNYVPLTTVELVVNNPARRSDPNAPMPGRHIFGFVKTRDVDSMLVAVAEWAPRIARGR
jgi:hypothetical protein